MSYKSSVVLACAIFLGCLLASAELKTLPKGVDSSDGCKVDNKFYKVGHEWSPRGSCQKHTCNKGGHITGITCALIRLPKDSECFLTETDPFQPYPECCPRVLCPPRDPEPREPRDPVPRGPELREPRDSVPREPRGPGPRAF